MPQNIDYSDVLHTGVHRFEQAVQVPAGSLGNAQVGTADPILATKLKHQYAPVYRQSHGVAAVAQRQVIHVARAAGDVIAAEAGLVVACTVTATVTVDVLKNGVTVLTSTIVLDNTNAAYAEESGAINAAVSAYVAGDVFEVNVTVAAGGGVLGQGLYVDVVFREGAG